MNSAFLLGDSKTVAANDTPPGAGFLPLMLSADHIFIENPARYAQDGIHMADMKANLPAQLALRTTTTPTHIFISLGVTDLHTNPYIPLPETFAGDYGDVLDMLHAQWSGAKIYLDRVWKRIEDENNAPELVQINDVIIPALVAARSDYCFLGVDERVYLENGDNGATMTYDGVHHNHAGYIAKAAAYLALLGYS